MLLKCEDRKTGSDWRQDYVKGVYFFGSLYC